MNPLRTLQNAYGRSYHIKTGGTVRIGKVVGMTTAARLIDVIFLDGGTVQNVVVLSHYLTNDAGLTMLPPAVSVDVDALPRKTVDAPNDRHIVDSYGVAVARKIAKEQGAKVPPHRDVYAACVPIEGRQNISGGWVCIGFLHPNSEVNFDTPRPLESIPGNPVPPDDGGGDEVMPPFTIPPPSGTPGTTGNQDLPRPQSASAPISTPAVNPQLTEPVATPQQAASGPAPTPAFTPPLFFPVNINPVLPPLPPGWHWEFPQFPTVLPKGPNTGPAGTGTASPGDGIPAFSGFIILRTTGDVQATIDRLGTTSVQHPSGGRFTLGQFYATPGFGQDPDVRTVGNGLDLTGQDRNGKYDLRYNLGQQTSAVIEDCNGNQVLLDGPGNRIIISTVAGATITLNGGGTIVAVSANGARMSLDDNATLSAGNSDGSSITVTPEDILFQTSQFSTSLNEFLTNYNAHPHPDPQGGVTGPPTTPVQ